MSTIYSNNIRPVSGTTDAISIDSSTNSVGIGTSSPASGYKLDVNGKAVVRDYLELHDDYCIQYWYKANGTDKLGWVLNRTDNTCQYVWADGQPLVFCTTTTGGTTSEKVRLTSDGTFRFGTDDAVDASNAGAEFYSGNFSELRCSVTSTGNSTQLRFYNGNGEVGSIKTNGSATAFNTSSDYRLKENEVAISDGITRLKTLKPYRFNFKADPSTVVDGFFAHEVKPAVPEAISGEKDGEEIQGIDQSKLVPLLTAALQESIAKIEALEARVAALESQA